MIGQRLKYERERLGMTQTEFGAIAGVGKTTVINWEKDVSSPTAVQLAALGEAKIGDDKIDVFYVLTGQRIVSLPQPAPHTQEEIEILVNYRRSREEDRRNIARTAELAGAAGKKPVPSRPSAREFGPSTERIPPREYGPDEAAESVDHKRGKKK